MAYKKKTSAEIEKARRRFSGIATLGTGLDLGSGLTTVAYKSAINTTEVALDSYNQLLSQADGAHATFLKLEKDLANISERMLAGIGTKYGFDSIEYEKGGGTRKSEKKKPVKKVAAVK